MRVLVTGGGGFLGGAAVRALVARGDTAIAFDTQWAGLSGTQAHDRLVRPALVMVARPPAAAAPSGGEEPAVADAAPASPETEVSGGNS